MKRRAFLQLVAAAPAVAVLPALPAPSAAVLRAQPWDPRFAEAVADWMALACNPPLTIDQDGLVRQLVTNMEHTKWLTLKGCK